MMETWVKQKIYLVASRAIEKVPPVIKSSLEDEDMPRCVSRGKDRLVDATWPNVREEVLWELAVYLDGEPPSQEEGEAAGVDCFRAFFRYHLFPFDKSLWGSFRDPVWIIFTLVSLVPVHGISPLSFLFIFFIIDKSDTFQLVQFILSFKGMQFITQGVIRSITGYFSFVACVTAPGNASGHKCASSGPGVYGKLGIAGIIGYFFTCFLVWLAFALLRCSTEKGRSTLKGALAEKAEHQQHTIRQKGGLILYFLWWDILLLLIVVGVCAWVISTRPHFALDDWAFSQAIFAAQIVHGLLSAPFFFFMLPGLARVLTHALPTFYDRSGRCVPPKPTAASEQYRKEAIAEPRQPLVSEDEAAELCARLRAKAGLPRVPGLSD